MPPTAKAIARRLLPHSLYRLYRRRKVASIIAGYEPREVEHTYGAHRLRVHLADPLGEGWYDRDWQEPRALAFLRERGVLHAGARVFDLGAHQAVIALMLAREVGAQGQVVAIEAEPHNARVALLNRELNDARNLVVLHAAGAARAGVLSFAEGLNGQIDEQSGAGNVEVPAVTVDDLARDYGAPQLVMIDVEGYEGHVLDGAAGVLEAGTSAFLVEIHEELAAFGGSASEILSRFERFERWVAVDDDDELLALDGAPPTGRFFLVAIPAAGTSPLSPPA
ncbi:MAG TPA: FkbM family methyltransferase [Solirubrobacteraceae bacterium]